MTIRKTLASLTPINNHSQIQDLHSMYIGLIEGSNVTNERSLSFALMLNWIVSNLSDTFAPINSVGNSPGYQNPQELLVALNSALNHSEWQHRDLTPAEVVQMIVDVEGEGWRIPGGGAAQLNLGQMNSSVTLEEITTDMIYVGECHQDTSVTVPEISSTGPYTLSFVVDQKNGGNHSFSLAFSGNENVTYGLNTAPVIGQAVDSRSVIIASSYKFDNAAREWIVYLATTNG